MVSLVTNVGTTYCFSYPSKSDENLQGICALIGHHPVAEHYKCCGQNFNEGRFLKKLSSGNCKARPKLAHLRKMQKNVSIIERLLNFF
jgi:hypothetical protein